MKKRVKTKNQKRKTARTVHSQVAGSQKGKRASRSTSCPIVGIGTSAGGLDAVSEFLRHVPPASGLAFVIVQHLDPKHKCIMSELLQRVTLMSVSEVVDRVRIRPNCVYVIPPNRDLSMLDGVLHLHAAEPLHGLRLPIDFFFRALAEDQREHSIGVILSGMGSDGTMGLRAIKEKAGLILVQDPSSAKFDGMPRSAIDAGLADVVAPVEQLPELIIAYLQKRIPSPHAEPVLDKAAQSALEKIIILLRLDVGHDFSSYKVNTLYRRIERRMRLHQIDKLPNYVRFLQENSQERELLFNELLIGVTRFFRDPEAWDQLKDQILPALFASRPGGARLRAWAAGCSTGEEVYSLAIVFKEALEQARPKGNFTLQIYGTDLDGGAIARARQGVYPANIAADVSADRLHRFFTKEENGSYRIGREIREMAIMARQNVIMDPPFTKLDFLICRNLLIYLNTELQKKLMQVFYYSLNPGGILFLGSSESVGGSTDLFSPLEGRWRFFRSNPSIERRTLLDFPSAFFPITENISQAARLQIPTANFQTLCEQVILQQFSPAAVLVNAKGDILYVNGRTGRYLEPASGKANWNIFVMAREGLRHELSNAFRKAQRQKKPVIINSPMVAGDTDQQMIRLTVQALTEPEALRGKIMVVFSESVLPPQHRAIGSNTKMLKQNSRYARDQQELQRLHQELLNARNEMQTSQEELKSTNEELQSLNEELQSSNEELTTSKEEMQSLNEELQTVNAELQSKVDELSATNNDMKNLLNSTEIATVFLDSNLRVRRFTTQATLLIKLIPGDIGRPVTDIASDLLYPGLADDVHEVLRTLVFSEKQIATRDGRTFSTRIMPYRTLENKIDGVVITFSDITAAKNLERELRAQPHNNIAMKNNISPSPVLTHGKLNKKG